MDTLPRMSYFMLYIFWGGCLRLKKNSRKVTQNVLCISFVLLVTCTLVSLYLYQYSTVFCHFNVYRFVLTWSTHPLQNNAAFRSGISVGWTITISHRNWEFTAQLLAVSSNSSSISLTTTTYSLRQAALELWMPGRCDLLDEWLPGMRFTMQQNCKRRPLKTCPPGPSNVD